MKKQHNHFYKAGPFAWAALLFFAVCILPMADADDSKATPKGECTHLIVFQPRGDFHPEEPEQLLDVLHKKLAPDGPAPGCFRARPVNGKLVGSICTNNPADLKRVIQSIPDLEFVRVERLTKKAFESHKNTSSESLPPPFVTPEGSYTHLVVFRPKGNFQPQHPEQLLNALNAKLSPEGGATGYFRTKPINGKLVGALCTDDLTGLKKTIQSIPELEFVRADRLTKKSFESYEKSRQESLPPPYATPTGGYTHAIVYGAKNGFVPTKPADYLNLVNPKLAVFGVHA